MLCNKFVSDSEFPPLARLSRRGDSLAIILFNATCSGSLRGAIIRAQFPALIIVYSAKTMGFILLFSLRAAFFRVPEAGGTIGLSSDHE